MVKILLQDNKTVFLQRRLPKVSFGDALYINLIE